MAIDRVLLVSPDAMRVKPELARCHAQLKSFQTARQSFLECWQPIHRKRSSRTYEYPHICIGIGRNTGQISNHVLTFTAKEPDPITILDKTRRMHVIRRRSSLFMLERVLKIFSKQLARAEKNK